jgi:Trk-type K+ transport system membrane component
MSPTSTLVPVIAAGILSASNGAFSIKYIDALFLCVSGMMGTGLITVDLSALTPWQQVIVVFVSLVGALDFLFFFFLRRARCPNFC